MKKTNAVGIISSSNVDGSSAALVRRMLKGAKDTGSDTHEIILSNYNISFCKGCSGCTRPGSCVIRDDLEKLKEKLEKADCIILSSPVYAAAINAQLKNLIDRLGMLEFLTGSVFGGKYIALIATASGFGANSAVNYLKMAVNSGMFSRSYLSGTLPVLLKGAKHISEIPKYLNKAYKLGKKLVKDHEKGKNYLFQNFLMNIVKSLIIKPSIKKNIVKYKDKELHGVYLKLAERGLV